MLLRIPETGVIKEQSFDISSDVTIIYGYNNSGKTTLLKVMDEVFHNRLMERFISGQEGELAVYIPTNRVIVSENNTNQWRLKDYEEFIHYQRDSYKDYSLHLKWLRDYLLANKIIHDFICRAVRRIFDLDIGEIKGRYSDGIENMIHIYLNVLWALTWNMDISCLTEERFCELRSRKQIYVMIDEIEMFLHVNIQSKLISSMKEDFSGCSFILTTHSPLLLTRYKQCAIYEIKDGRLDKIEEDMYYEDLDLIYEQLFEVEELPMEAREDINYLGNVILSRKDVDSGKIRLAAKRLEEEYPNLYRRYDYIITRAESIGKGND